jgi:PmbA protein
MNELVKQCLTSADAAEIYWMRERGTQVLFRNGQLSRVNEDALSSVAVRVIEDGRLGLSYGTMPVPNLVAEAKTAAANGGPAGFSFAPADAIPSPVLFDERAARLGSEALVAFCEEAKRVVLDALPGVALSVHCQVSEETLVVASTAGADGEQHVSRFVLALSAPIKGAGTGVSKQRTGIAPFEVPEDLIAGFVTRYRDTERTSRPKTGRLPVLFAPEASFLLTLPLCAGLSGDAVAKGTSPLVDRLGRAILSERLTIVDDPTVDGDAFSRRFDDEGVPCARRVLVEKGQLRGYLLDLHAAAALQSASTGNGYKRALFGGGTETPPSPWPGHLFIEPGEVSAGDLIASIDEGILLTGGMGFHSGNYPQGDFAVQALGYHVRNGTIQGRLQGTMVAGNIYRDLLHVRGISREREESSGGVAPYVLVESLQVAG